LLSVEMSAKGKGRAVDDSEPRVVDVQLSQADGAGAVDGAEGA